MKHNKIFLVLGLATTVLASCSDPMDEITELKLDRNLSPVGIEAKGVGETSARLQWTATEGATSYEIEVFADDSLTFEGTPAKTMSVTTNEARLTDLVYDTKYSARIKALTEGQPNRDSKWAKVFFRTSAQQIFNSIKEEQIADRSVILTWPEGEAATKIVVTAVEAKTSFTRELTADEVAAGKAVVEGLQPETKYSFVLYNGEKKRGTREATTIADLNGAILVHAGDDIKAIVAEAPEGATLALYGGTHLIEGAEDVVAGALVVNKNLTIKGIYPTNIPTINGRFQIEEGASLSLSQLILDGTGTSGDQTFNFKTADVTYGALDVQNVEIMNFTKGVFYANVAATIEAITFNNCLIHDVICEGGDLFDCRKSYIKALSFTNTTIYHCATTRDFIRMDDASGSFTDATPVITVDHCTIDNCCNEAANKRLLYVRFVGNTISWSNNLVTNTQAIFSNQSKTSVPEFKNNAYFAADNLKTVVEKDGNLFTDDSATWLTASPYKTSSPNFTYNEDNAKKNWGDQRWAK